MTALSTVSRRGFWGPPPRRRRLPALAAECRLGPPPHEKGPLAFMNYDQAELDAAYDSRPMKRILLRSGAWCLEQRRRSCPARRAATRRLRPDGDRAARYLPRQAGACADLHLHPWRDLARTGSSRGSAAPAELFHDHGAHYIALDFVNVLEAGGDLRPMAQQVRRAIAWAAKHAASFGGDARRIYIGGHSSGGHLAGVALVTDWQKDFGLPADTIKGGICISGMYDMKPVRLSARSNYVKFDDAMEELDDHDPPSVAAAAPVTVAYGTSRRRNSSARAAISPRP